MNRLVLSRRILLSRFLTRSFNGLSKNSKFAFSSAKLPRTKPDTRAIQSSNKYWQMPKTPDLIYMPHILRWIKTKLRFKFLKKIWDPEFSEGAFIYGTTQAVCRITEIINSGKTELLEGLMTISARIKLKDDVKFRLTPVQKKLIVLKPEDIKILVPVTVSLTKEGPAKICRVGLRVLALKWHEVASENYKLVLVALQTEFMRDYSENALPEWIISSFSILECTMLSEATATR